MLSFSQALTNAANTAKWTVGFCDNFVANMYGYQNSGYSTALAHWNSTPAQYKHPGSTSPPAGALVFWGGGDGHVAIADGNGSIYSTDIGGQGTVTKVPLGQISSQWGKPYLGWASPYFFDSAGGVGNATATQASLTSLTTPASSSSPLSTGFGVVLNPIADSFLNAFGVSDLKDLAERAGLIILGGVLLLVGLWRFAGGKKLNVVQNSMKAHRTGLATANREVRGSEEATGLSA